MHTLEIAPAWPIAETLPGSEAASRLRAPYHGSMGHPVPTGDIGGAT